MATFQVDDVVRKSGGQQKYKIVEVLPLVVTQKYLCKFEPEMASYVKFTFKETDLESVS